MKWFTPIAAVAAAVVVGGTALAVGTSNWSHTTEADYKNGTFDNVVATNLGDLKLSLRGEDAAGAGPAGQRGERDGRGHRRRGLRRHRPARHPAPRKGETVEKVAAIDDATNIFSLTFDKDAAADRHRRREGPRARGPRSPARSRRRSSPPRACSTSGRSGRRRTATCTPPPARPGSSGRSSRTAPSGSCSTATRTT